MPARSNLRSRFLPGAAIAVLLLAFAAAIPLGLSSLAAASATSPRAQVTTLTLYPLVALPVLHALLAP